MKIAKDGYSTIILTFTFALFASILGFVFLPWQELSIGLALFWVILFLFVVYFFRNPDRTIPEGEDLLLSPADGKVILLDTGIDHPYVGKNATRLSIFLSPMDVHVNRVPAHGIIEKATYFPGKYLVAWHEKASELNERSEFHLKHPSGTKIFFNQITGFLARRIVFHIDEGDTVKAGFLFGMMKFGSRMDIIIPPTVKLNIVKGQVVVGGETILGEIT